MQNADITFYPLKYFQIFSEMVEAAAQVIKASDAEMVMGVSRARDIFNREITTPIFSI